MAVAAVEAPLVLNLAEFSDGELIDAMSSARRQASRAQAMELAAVAELARRRHEETIAHRHAHRPVEAISPDDYVQDEIASALTLTARAAADLIDFAAALAEELPATLTALGSGEIDYCKARTLWHGTRLVDKTLVERVEAAILTKASEQTTGEIRAKIRRLVKKLDPDAYERRRTAAEGQRRVELTGDDNGTAHLAGCDLPAEAAESAYARINAIAAAIRADGDTRGIDQLRADVFLSLLRGAADFAEPPAAAPKNVRAEPAWTDLDDLTAAAIGRAVRAALDRLGEDLPARHHGLPALLRRTGERVSASLDALKTPWCVERLHDDDQHPEDSPAPRPDQPANHNQAPRRDERTNRNTAPRQGEPLGSDQPPGQQRHPGFLTRVDKNSWHGSPSYRPPAAMRRLVEYRDGRCRYPGCRRPSQRADIDHTLPYDQGGATCPCNLAMLCRRHHMLKQTKGWTLIHIWPGVLLWINPTGHWRVITPLDRE